MPVKRIEGLADCIAFLNDFHNPESISYRLRNPGLCRAHSFKQLNSVDDEGRRIFTSAIGGYRFLLCDLEWKISGRTRAKGESGRLKPTSPLSDLLKSFRLSAIDKQMQAVTFLNLALDTDKIQITTELQYFVENGVK
ncbi:MAG: hypothetical protein ACREQ5_12635 [Candidatus Dormibacteria bacterium]